MKYLLEVSCHFVAFHSERRLSRVSIRITTLIAVHNALWIGTENGIIVSFPFSSPTIVAEEAGWEVSILFLILCIVDTYEVQCTSLKK